MTKLNFKLISGLIATVAILTLVVMLSGNNSILTRDEGSKEIDLSEITISRTNGDRLYQEKSFTGEAVSYHQNGQRAKAEQFVNGRRDGHLKKWFEDGVLAYEAFYDVGKRQGTSKSWWSNSNQRSQTEYVDDKPEGIAWKWYRGGEKYKKFNYLAGQPIGIQQAWRTNGKLFSNFEYKNGRIFGLRKANLCVTLEDEQIQLN